MIGNIIGRCRESRVVTISKRRRRYRAYPSLDQWRKRGNPNGLVLKGISEGCHCSWSDSGPWASVDTAQRTTSYGIPSGLTIPF